MPPKDVIDRIKLAHGLTSILDQMSGPVAEELAEQLAPHLRPGEELPDLELTHRLLGRLVMSRLQVLIAADEVYQRTLEQLDGVDPEDLDGE